MNQNSTSVDSNHFRTEDGTLDLKKVLLASNFPIYILNSPTPGYELTGTGFGYAQATVTDVSFHFRLPTPSASIDPAPLEQQIVVANFLAQHWMHGTGPDELLYLALLSLGKPNGTYQLSAQFSDLFSHWDKKKIDPKQISQLRQAISQVRWETHGEWIMPMQLQHWPGEMSVALAHSGDDVVQIIIAAVGLSRPEFTQALASLTLLQPDDDPFITKLQSQLRGDDEVLKWTGKQL